MARADLGALWTATSLPETGDFRVPVASAAAYCDCLSEASDVVRLDGTGFLSGDAALGGAGGARTGLADGRGEVTDGGGIVGTADISVSGLDLAATAPRGGRGPAATTGCGAAEATTARRARSGATRPRAARATPGLRGRPGATRSTAGRGTKWRSAGGADSFVYGRRDGRGKLKDFRQGKDEIVIESGAGRVEGRSIEGRKGDVIAAFAKTAIRIDDAEVSEFGPGDFAFV